MNRPNNNITTVRSDMLLWNHPSVKPSRNVGEARLKVLRMYTRCCRLVPFLIRIWGMQKKISIPQFKDNVASYIRQNAHLRRPEDIDHNVNKGINYFIYVFYLLGFRVCCAA